MKDLLFYICNIIIVVACTLCTIYVGFYCMIYKSVMNICDAIDLHTLTSRLIGENICCIIFAPIVMMVIIFISLTIQSLVCAIFDYR